jgi:GAF domain-containing protein
LRFVARQGAALGRRSNSIHRGRAHITPSMTTTTMPNRQRTENLRTTVRQLGAGLVGKDLSIQAFRAGLCEALQRGFKCSQASLWRFVGEPGDLVLRCVGMHSEARGGEESRAELREHEYDVYFSELLKRGVYASPDVLNDPNLQGLVEPYFKHTGVRSLLDVAFQANGKAFGVLCIEQVGECREWTPAEHALARQVAALISLAVARLPPTFEFHQG